MLTLIFRTLLIYLFVVLAVRIMGKRQVADMQASELVITLIISEVASLPMQNIDQPLLSGFIPIIVLIAVEIAVSVVMMKSRRLRGIICGHPIIVIRDGELVQDQLKRLRISYEDLYSLMRQQEIFELKSIKYGIIEPNGSLSILKAEDYQPTDTIESEELKEQLGAVSNSVKGGDHA